MKMAVSLASRLFSTRLINRVLARLAFLLVALVPLLLTQIDRLRSPLVPPPPAPPAPIVYPKFAGTDPRLVAFCITNIKNNRAFVLFRHGTCVMVPTEGTAIEIRAEARRLLKKTADPAAKFVCSPTSDNHLIVSYTEPVFHLRFAEDLELFRHDIINDYRRFLSPKEAAETSYTWNPPFHAKVGLRSRARLLKDSEELKIARVIAPRVALSASLGLDDDSN
ncbi:MAG: hypothetical protein AAGC74_07600 [Verrucomicrobiota bacterium]